ncbi:YgjV family protein [Lactobacillus agilis]|uniref:YgjV family protein n=1 Tax=Ligilactobacillus agilis TaxID=1601 RepID=UPI00142FF6DF|nr:YgjV family protein [Ligilactobacillus agilis]NJE32496.1 YgjV family protein [Ligilactobacillus agilis]
MTKFVLIQAVGFLGTIVFFLSYQCRDNKKLFQMQFASYLFYTTHLLLLGAITGGVSYVLNTVRSFCLGSRVAFLRSQWMCGLICCLQLLTLYATWANWWSTLPVVANIAATIGGYTHNPRKIRMVGLTVNSPLWIIYDVAVGSWAGIFDELATSISVLLSIWRYGWKNLDRVEN